MRTVRIFLPSFDSSKYTSNPLISGICTSAIRHAVWPTRDQDRTKLAFSLALEHAECTFLSGDLMKALGPAREQQYRSAGSGVLDGAAGSGPYRLRRRGIAPSLPARSANGADLQAGEDRGRHIGVVDVPRSLVATDWEASTLRRNRTGDWWPIRCCSLLRTPRTRLAGVRPRPGQDCGRRSYHCGRELAHEHPEHLRRE